MFDYQLFDSVDPYDPLAYMIYEDATEDDDDDGDEEDDDDW